MASTTSGLSNLMSTYYDKIFLDRAESELQYDFGAQMRKVPMNAGKTVVFNRFSTLAAATTALTEGSNPAGSDMTSTQVSATVAEYGDFVKVSSLFEMTSLDEGLKEHAEVMGYQAGLTVDTLIKNTLSAGATVQFAGAKTALSALSATDVLSSTEIKKAVRTLRQNKAKTFANGLFRGIVPTSAVYDLRGDSTWLSAQIYTDASKVKNGSIGALHGVDFLETNNESSESSTVTVYHTFIFGMNAYGSINLQGQPDKKIIVKKPNEGDTSNPLNMFSTIGWKLTFVSKVLNAAWIIVVKTGVSS